MAVHNLIICPQKLQGDSKPSMCFSACSSNFTANALNLSPNRPAGVRPPFKISEPSFQIESHRSWCKIDCPGNGRLKTTSFHPHHCLLSVICLTEIPPREGGNQGKVSLVHWPFPLVQEHLSSDVNAKVDYSYGIFLRGREAIKKRSLMFTDPSQPSPPWPIRRHSKPALIFI